MTLPTNINTVLQLGFAEVLFEIGAPMHFFGNKVVISKARFSVTTRALYLPHRHLYLFAWPAAIEADGLYLIFNGD